MNPNDPFIGQIIEQARRAKSAPPTGLPQEEQVHPAISAMPDDQLDSALQQLLAQHQGRMSNFNLQEVPRPQSNNEPDVGGRFFLSGLVHGVNQGVGRHGEKDQTSALRQMLLAEQVRKAHAGAEKANAPATLKGTPQAKAEKVDPLLEDKHAWWAARTKKEGANYDSAEALARKRGRPDAAKGGRGGSGSGGKGGKITEAAERSQINAEFSAEKQRITGAFKQKYGNIHDQVNSAGMSTGTGIRDQAVARGVAEVEHRHQMALRRHAEKWGLDTALPPEAHPAVDPNSPEGIAAQMRAARSKK